MPETNLQTKKKETLARGGGGRGGGKGKGPKSNFRGKAVGCTGWGKDAVEKKNKEKGDPGRPTLGDTGPLDVIYTGKKENPKKRRKKGKGGQQKSGVADRRYWGK